jgi:hypothetical protein
MPVPDQSPSRHELIDPIAPVHCWKLDTVFGFIALGFFFGGPPGLQRPGLRAPMPRPSI